MAVPPLLLLDPQVVVAEQFLGLGRGRLVITAVVGEAGDRGVREFLVLDPVPLTQFQRLDAQLGGEPSGRVEDLEHPGIQVLKFTAGSVRYAGGLAHGLSG